MDILEKNNPILRRKAKPLSLKEITSPKTHTLITRMHEVLLHEPDGVALAAPQIGVSIRLFIVSPKIFLAGKPGVEEKRTSRTDKKKLTPADNCIYINPQILKRSRKKTSMDEGCLSVRNYYGKVERYDKATISAYDEHGKKFTRGASGLLAQIFQHEMDHLEGVLFSDRAEPLFYVPPETRKKRDEI